MSFSARMAKMRRKKRRSSAAGEPSWLPQFPYGVVMGYNPSMHGELLDRFLDYASYDTMSDGARADEGVRPSAEGEERLLLHLKEELEALGIEAFYGEEKVLCARIRGSADAAPIGFMAHVDTADDVPGNGVRPVVHRDFVPGDIVLGDTVISLDGNPDLARYAGGTVITSSGDTLLGSDDKAGVAIMMEAARLLVQGDMPHGDVELYFTPDEETGHGVDRFPSTWGKAGIIYTVDGEEEGIVENECFNAASVYITIKGNAVHLGSARGVLRNAVTAAAYIISSLPASESPEATDGRYGYYAADNLHASIPDASFEVIIRDFDYDGLQRRIAAVESIAEAARHIYGADVSVRTVIRYRNMAEACASRPEAMSLLERAAQSIGMKLERRAIRGGTDGANLAALGIASPNIFTGGHNLHSVREWVAVEAMASSLSLVMAIIREAAV